MLSFLSHCMNLELILSEGFDIIYEGLLYSLPSCFSLLLLLSAIRVGRSLDSIYPKSKHCSLELNSRRVKYSPF